MIAYIKAKCKINIHNMVSKIEFRTTGATFEKTCICLHTNWMPLRMGVPENCSRIISDPTRPTDVSSIILWQSDKRCRWRFLGSPSWIPLKECSDLFFLLFTAKCFDFINFFLPIVTRETRRRIKVFMVLERKLKKFIKTSYNSR